MNNKTIPPTRTDNFFRLPLKQGTRILTLITLNQYSDFRSPKRPYLRIQTRKISFYNEVLTIGVILNDEEEERIYLKATFSELLVSCSVDTEEGYLSRYAYFALYKMMSVYDLYDFEDYFWPGFFDPKTGESKFLRIYKSRDGLYISTKVIYKGLYKPENYLPAIANDIHVTREAITIPKEVQARDEGIVLGYSLSDTNPEGWRSNHYPFLIPYAGILDKNKTYIKGFKTYILSEKDLPDINLTSVQQSLIEICFEMKKIALILQPQYRDEINVTIERHQTNKQNFIRLFELWQRAYPLLTSRLHTHYRFTYGMRNVKGKPLKSAMIPCDFGAEIPELCFLWKDKGDYFKLELRFMLGKQIYEVHNYLHTTFFIVPSAEPARYFLLNSLMDCEVVRFFCKRHFQLLMLKVHYDVYCKDFVDRLRATYRFINK